MLLPIFVAVSEANLLISGFIFMDYLHWCYSKYVTWDMTSDNHGNATQRNITSLTFYNQSFQNQKPVCQQWSRRSPQVREGGVNNSAVKTSLRLLLWITTWELNFESKFL